MKKNLFALKQSYQILRLLYHWLNQTLSIQGQYQMV